MNAKSTQNLEIHLCGPLILVTFALSVVCSLSGVEERKKLFLHAQATRQEHNKNFTHYQKRPETETAL